MRPVVYSEVMTVVDAGQRIVLHTDWEGYTKFLEAAESRRVRITYDRGDLELMTPSGLHEQSSRFLSQLVEAVLLQKAIDYRPGGSTTLRIHLADRGLEPDSCYWIQSFDRSGVEVDLDQGHPPPDLALEVEVSRSALDRMGIYWALGVPEVWRLTREGDLLVETLEESGRDLRRTESPTLPGLKVAELPRFVELGLKRGSTAMLQAFGDWLKAGGG